MRQLEQFHPHFSRRQTLKRSHQKAHEKSLFPQIQLQALQGGKVAQGLKIQSHFLLIRRQKRKHIRSAKQQYFQFQKKKKKKKKSKAKCKKKNLPLPKLFVNHRHNTQQKLFAGEIGRRHIGPQIRFQVLGRFQELNPTHILSQQHVAIHLLHHVQGKAFFAVLECKQKEKQKNKKQKQKKKKKSLSQALLAALLAH
jgi:hypothetical protein